jgi:DnaJ-class molecular chaperone
MTSITNYTEMPYTVAKVTCVRCGGSGKANFLTFPDQANYCRLCKGKGVENVRVYQIRK